MPTELSILSLYERYAFSILDCPLSRARKAILEQASAWKRPLVFERETVRDVRPILDSPDGPARPPELRKAILLSEVEGPNGKKTLFVSSVADGYSSMVYMVSSKVPGIHVSIQISRSSIQYPRNALTALQAEECVRVVYAMRDTNRWEFFQNGTPMPFEDVSLYSARLKRNRVTPEIISRYLLKIGYGSIDRSYWICDETATILYERDFRFPDGVEPRAPA